MAKVGRSRLPYKEGERFGRLTVIGISSKQCSGEIRYCWVCRCDCGNVVEKFPSAVKGGGVSSCGCIKKEMLSAKRSLHNMTGTRLYCIWRNMIGRCTNPNIPNYRIYGGRGIKICEEWLNNFQSFYADVISGYRDDLFIDRIDNNGNYEKSNIRWATRGQQNRNKRNNVILCRDGVSKTIAGWCEIYGIGSQTYRKRIKYGWDSEKALTTPVCITHRKKSHNRKKIFYTKKK